MSGHIAVKDLSAFVGNYEEAVEQPEGHRRHRGEVHGNDDFAVVLEERKPLSARVPPATNPHKIPGYAPFRHDEAQLLQLAVDLGSSPFWVLCCQALNQTTDFAGDSWPTAARADRQRHVHKNSVTVCVLAPSGQRHIETKRRKFRTFTRDLKQMRAWLKNCQVTEIAMESTGQYWRALWNLLEGEFARVILVNPQHIKGLNGYKTDPKDTQWIADLLENGKLRGSWVPPRPIRELRDLTRERVHVLEDLNRAKNRIEQLCQTGNIKVSSVATDLFGVSGRKMLKAIVEGKHDAGWMADYAKGQLRRKRGELELALEGTFTSQTTLATGEGTAAGGMAGRAGRDVREADRARDCRL
jgi:transposase